MEDDKIITSLRQFLIDGTILKARLSLLKLEFNKLTSGPRDMKSAIISDMPRSNNVDSTVTELNRLINIQIEIEELENYIQITDTIISSLDVGKPNKIYSRILDGYYIQGKNISELANEFNLSKMTISTYKKAAIYNLTVLLEGTKSCNSIFRGE